MNDLLSPKSDKPGRRKYSVESFQYLDEEELHRLFQSLQTNRDRALFEVAFHRGLRASEVGLLQRSDLRLEAKRLFVHRLKGGISGEYHLTKRELVALRRWIDERGDAQGPLFISRKKRGRIGRRQLDRLMKKFGSIAGLPESKQHFHCLRHSAGTHLGEMADPAEVMDHLGHRDIRSTMKYLKVRNKRRNELGARLERAW